MIPNDKIKESTELLNQFIETKEVEFADVGLCYNCKIPIEVQLLFKHWEHYSGFELYPIPSGKKHIGPFSYYHSKESKLYAGKQLKFRLSLAKFAVEKLNEIKIEQDRIRNLP
jgi:hypothetical protein